MLEGLDPRLVVKQTPRGGLQAAEYEGAGKGELRVDGKSVVYHDYLTEGDLLTLTYASRREAGLQQYREQHAYDAAGHSMISSDGGPFGSFSGSMPHTSSTCRLNQVSYGVVAAAYAAAAGLACLRSVQQITRTPPARSCRCQVSLSIP